MVSRAALAGALIIVAGCVADGPQPAAPARPRDLPAPRGLAPDRIVLQVSQAPEDADGDGFVDTYGVEVFLFGPHELPFHADGAFIFILADEQGERLAEWRIPPELNSSYRLTVESLERYAFRLNASEVGDERTALTNGVLLAAFYPQGAADAVIRKALPVRVGRSR